MKLEAATLFSFLTSKNELLFDIFLYFAPVYNNVIDQQQLTH